MSLYRRIVTEAKDSLMSKTETGIAVKLASAHPGAVKATFTHPIAGDLTVIGTWTTFKGKAGLVGRTKINGRETVIRVSIPKRDFDAVVRPHAVPTEATKAKAKAYADVEALERAAERKRDYPGDYFRALAKAKKARKQWEKDYP